MSKYIIAWADEPDDRVVEADSHTDALKKFITMFEDCVVDKFYVVDTVEAGIYHYVPVNTDALREAHENGYDEGYQKGYDDAVKNAAAAMAGEPPIWKEKKRK